MSHLYKGSQANYLSTPTPSLTKPLLHDPSFSVQSPSLTSIKELSGFLLPPLSFLLLDSPPNFVFGFPQLTRSEVGIAAQPLLNNALDEDTLDRGYVHVVFAVHL